jgi:hypothetical protein
MNFQRLNEFLKKKRIGNSGSDMWQHLIGRDRVSHRQVGPLTGQWSTVNFDRVETGLWRAGLGLDTGQVGLIWAGPGQTHGGSTWCHVTLWI